MKALTILAWVLAIGLGAATVQAAGAGDGLRRPLGGHVPTALASAIPLPPSLPAPKAMGEELTITVVLQRADQAGFEQFLREVYDQQSPRYRKFLTPLELADRYGPSTGAYAQVRDYFEREGFTLVADSANRQTLTLRSSRQNAERALSVRVGDYRIGERTFFANDTDPQLPAEIASKVNAIVGLSSLARPEPQWNAVVKAFGAVWYQLCKLAEGPAPTVLNSITSEASNTPPKSQCGSPPDLIRDVRTHSGPLAAPVPWKSARGTGQKVGILAYDTFVPNDVANFLAFAALPASNIAKLSQVHVNGGATLGANQDEVLLDITTVMAVAPGAQVVVYDSPANASFQSIFNAMVNDHVSIISNSWAYCENQTTLSDVQSLDAIFQTAAAAGISVFNASGDSGTTCLNGAPNTVAVPASAPNATAVGGSSLTTGPGGVYVSEKWWNGTSDTPPTGQGGYGTSQFFNRPAYQNGLTNAAMRSVPDVAVNSDPARGVMICKESGGGCPTGGLFGGTSVGAPYWAAFTAILNEAQGQNVGLLNPQIYPLAATPAFHSATSMGSDFAHVGLGSPDMNRLHLALAGQTAGVVSASTSTVVPYAFGLPPADGAPIQGPPADGSTPMQIVVSLRDIDGNVVSGKTVTLAKNAGSGAVITPPSGVSSAANGTVTFTVTNLVAENVDFTANDVTDGVMLAPQSVTFAVPPAAGASINASPNIVLNDGIATTTITVTLQDALARPTPGKLIQLAQGAGRSVISGPAPPVTNASGQVVFTATDLFVETVTYTAVDVTDGNLPIPGTAVVNFGGQGEFSCVTGGSPTPAPGFSLTPFSTGYATGNLFFGNVNWGCRGASYPGFAADGSAYVANFVDGALFKLPPQGGAATSGNKLSTLGPTTFGPVFGKDGKLYINRGATTGNFFTGAIFEIDPTTRAVLRTVMSGITCPQPMVVDPLSGDLFTDDACFGAGSDNPSIWRISNPGSANPTLSVYTTLPSTPAGWLSFAPDGTLYVPQHVTNPAGSPVLRISGTNVPGTPTQTPVPGLNTLYWVTVGEVLPNGAAKSLIILDGVTLKLQLADITTNPPTFTDLTTTPSGSGVIGPDGCLYLSSIDTIFKLAPTGGGCGFNPTNPGPSFTLSPASVSPAAAQGTTHTLVAELKNMGVPAGTGVTFRIDGANAQLRSAVTDAAGKATITYTGVVIGTDRIVASATVAGTQTTSNQATITWTGAGGKHATFLSLNGAPGSATAGVQTTLAASLFDVAVVPNTPIAGATHPVHAGAAVLQWGHQCAGTRRLPRYCLRRRVPSRYWKLLGRRHAIAGHVGPVTSGAWPAQHGLGDIAVVGSGGHGVHADGNGHRHFADRGRIVPQ